MKRRSALSLFAGGIAGGIVGDNIGDIAGDNVGGRARLAPPRDAYLFAYFVKNRADRGQSAPAAPVGRPRT
ncbi:hypothetical protein AB2N08_02820 [Massilia aurea]|uniref:hypothetical protein n=1 Tax=Massilia aurea TaxID=373040 RepID=UPI0034623683